VVTTSSRAETARRAAHDDGDDVAARGARGALVDVELTGTGLGLAVQLLIVAALMSITCGLYLPWAAMQLAAWVDERTKVLGVYNEWTGRALDWLVQRIIILALTTVTLGLYWPWGVCRMQRWVNGQGPIGNDRGLFTGAGTGLLVRYVVWSVIVTLTLGIGWPWALCALQRWHAENTWTGARRMRFHGRGLDLLVFLLWNLVLLLVTFGLWTPWFHTGYLRWVYARTSVDPEDTRALAVAEAASEADRLLPGLGFAALLVLAVGVAISAEWRDQARTLVDDVAARARAVTGSIDRARATDAPAQADAPPIGTGVLPDPATPELPIVGAPPPADASELGADLSALAGAERCQWALPEEGVGARKVRCHSGMFVFEDEAGTPQIVSNIHDVPRAVLGDIATFLER
jgi:uncharacterized membrane protein YjgN (DUF898 family)